MDPAAVRNAPTFDFEIKNSLPVELGDLTQSLYALSDEFRRYVAGAEPEAAAGDVRLYVKEIRSGSIIGALVSASPQIVQVAEYLNTVGGFATYLKVAYDYLTGKSNDKPQLDKTSYENLTKIVEPVAKDRASQFNIGTNFGNVYLAITSSDANAAQNAARREIERLDDQGSTTHENVLLYWYQARDDVNSKTGDKGIIEAISPKAVKVRFPNDGVKAKMLHGSVNPFRQAYLVDVMVQTIRGKPAIYLVTNVRDSFEREEE